MDVYLRGSQNVQIAVLQPRLLSVYALKTKKGNTDHGTQHYLELIYEHGLRRSAANFTIGSFGGIQNRDFVCVQSLDGLLNFYEQENYIFSCFIPDFLLASPIAYVKKTDNFIMCSSNWCILSYKYKSLSEAGEKYDSNVSSTRKINFDWSYNLGESVTDICVVEDFINKEDWIMVLGERNLFCLYSNGKLKFMKRLDYMPICFNVYVLGENIFSLVVSETSTLLVYENTTLKWSAKLQFLPVSIKRAFLNTIKGALVLLSDDGRLECCYLGTEPSLFVAPPVAAKEIDYVKVEEELNRLNKDLNEADLEGGKLLKSESNKHISLQITINPDLVPCTFESNMKDIENHQMCAITIDILPQTVLEGVQVCVKVECPLIVIPKVQFYSNLEDRTSFTCYVFLNEVCEIPSLSIEIVAIVISSLGIQKPIVHTSLLPVNLVYELSKPQKESIHKVTLNINKSPISLATLFPEFVDKETFNQSSNAIGLKNIADAGKPVTILLAKSSERYRLQSDSFASLSLLIELVISRLKKHYTDAGDFRVSFNSSLPANEVIFYIDNHFRSRQQVNKLQEDVTQLSAQYRIIQKRLISKYKSKKPSPLTNLELLLHDTYEEIIEISEEINQKNNELTKAQIELSCALNVVQNMIKIMDINKELKKSLVSAFGNNVRDVDYQGWEGLMDASLCYLLRTVLAKSEKDKLRIATNTFGELKDISKLEKHLTQVFERIPRKTKDAAEEFIAEEEEEEIPPDEQSELPEMETRPIGTQFGEASSRLLSARKSLLRRRHKQDD